MTIRDGSGTILATAIVDASGSYSLTITATLSDGTHSLTITATDPAGNTSVGQNMSLVINSIPPTPPVLA